MREWRAIHDWKCSRQVKEYRNVSIPFAFCERSWLINLISIADLVAWREVNLDAADSEVVTVRHRERVNAVYKKKKKKRDGAAGERLRECLRSDTLELQPPNSRREISSTSEVSLCRLPVTPSQPKETTTLLISIMTDHTCLFFNLIQIGLGKTYSFESSFLFSNFDYKTYVTACSYNLLFCIPLYSMVRIYSRILYCSFF